MSEQTNPWLEITKQKTEGVWNQIDACRKFEEIKNLYFHPEPLTHFLTREREVIPNQTPLLSKYYYDAYELDIADNMIDFYTSCTIEELFSFLNSEGWEDEEINVIVNWLNNTFNPQPEQLVDFLHEKGYW